MSNTNNKQNILYNEEVIVITKLFSLLFFLFTLNPLSPLEYTLHASKHNLLSKQRHPGIETSRPCVMIRFTVQSHA